MGKVKYIIIFSIPFLLMLLKNYINGPLFEGKESMEGKTVIVTGSNTGIGLQTALGLAVRHSRVILACRNLTKAENAAKEIRKVTNNGILVPKQLDLSSFKSIRAFSDDVIKTEDKIDVLVNNAGIMGIDKSYTEDGHEIVFATNHLGPFLLTSLLLDKITKTPNSRIVTVSSAIHNIGVINFEDLNSDKEKYETFKVYANSKFANALMSRTLSKRLKDTDVGVYCLHPGLIMTDLGRHFRESIPESILPVTDILAKFLIKDSWQGAQTTLYCAVADELAGVKGKYYSDCAESTYAENVYDDELAEKLWNVSEKLTGLRK